MKRFLILIMLSGLPDWSFSNHVVIDFYGQSIVFEYDANIIFQTALKPNEQELKKFHNYILRSNFASLLTQLQVYQHDLRLNDWLYYNLVDRLSRSIDKRETNASFLTWFLLGKSGYKNQVTFLKNKLLIWLESEENSISGLRQMRDSYCINCGNTSFQTHGLSRFNPFQNNKKAFSFLFDPLPNFSTRNYRSKTFSLNLPDSSAKIIEVKFNTELLHCLRDFDGFNMSQVFSVPLSPGANNLLIAIAEIVADFSDSAKVEYITAFTRKVSKYKADQATFQKEKWMSPEEYLYYDSGDCEDRSSFLFFALKQIVKRPLVIIDYPDISHVNIGISLELKKKPNFYYDGLPYYVVEPTAIFGVIPLGEDVSFMETRYEIVGVK